MQLKSILRRVDLRYLAVSALFLLSSCMTLFRMSSSADAAQLTNRKLSLSSNVNSGTSTWTFTFTTTVATGGFEFVICTTPLLGASCTGPAGLDTVSLASVTASSSPAGMAVATAGNAPACSLTSNTAPASSNTVAGAGNSNYCAVRVTSASTIASGVTTVTLSNMPNPTAAGTFYVRIASYTGTSNAFTGFTDYGAVSQSVRSAMQVAFKIQETLQFCTGGTTVNSAAGAMGTGNTCDSSGVTNYTTGVDMGIGGTSAVVVTPVATSPGNNANGFVLLRTNAANGTSIQYRVIQVSSSGDLRATGSCTLTSGRSTVLVDPCINSVDQTQTGGAGSTISAGVEHFGMAIPYATNTTAGGATSALTKDANYDGDGATGGTCVPASGAFCWTWQYDGTAATIGTATGPVDDEALILKFAAAVSSTTPTGAYTVSLDTFAVPTY